MYGRIIGSCCSWGDSLVRNDSHMNTMRTAMFPVARHVNASDTSRRFNAWALVLLAIYAVLVVLAAACPLDHALDIHHSAHAHNHSSMHTILCNWSCQLSSAPPSISLCDRITLPGFVLITTPLLTQHLPMGIDILPELRGPPVHLVRT